MEVGTHLGLEKGGTGQARKKSGWAQTVLVSSTTEAH